eukprot:1939041-Amphidinium_carterae.1
MAANLRQRDVHIWRTVPFKKLQQWDERLDAFTRDWLSRLLGAAPLTEDQWHIATTTAHLDGLSLPMRTREAAMHYMAARLRQRLDAAYPHPWTPHERDAMD